MPQIREQIAMVHLPPSKTLKYLFHVRKTKVANLLGLAAFLFLLLNCKTGAKLLKILLLQYMALDR